MGALCCCPCGDEFEEFAYPLHRRCVCLRCFLHQLSSGYNSMFHRLEGRSVSTQLQGATALVSSGSSTALAENALADQRYLRLPRDGLIFRRDKSMTNLQEASQPLRRNKSSSRVELLGYSKKWDTVNPKEVDKDSAAEFANTLAFTQTSSEEEDVCPTCLDEYTAENPKIITHCSHHFHLACIYEWLERSYSCPICGKEMEFCESP